MINFERKHLGYRLAFRAVLIALILGVFFSAGQIYFDIKDQKKINSDLIEQVIGSILPQASEAAFELNAALAGRLVVATQAYTPIYYVEILADDGRVLAKQEKAKSNFRWGFLAENQFSDLREFELPLYHDKYDSTVGSLTLKIDVALIGQGIIHRAGVIIFVELARNIILALILVYLFNRLLTGPLIRLSQQFTATTHDARALDTLPCPDDHKEDELGSLINTVNNHLKARKKLEGALVQSQKMSAIGQLTGGIAHDFNNMLGVIMGNLELLLQQLPKDPEAERFAQAAYSGAERGARITSKLLRFSRHVAGSAELVELNPYIEDMWDLISKSMTKKVTIKKLLTHNIWPVLIDTGDFEDALLNLCLNAGDAMPESGHLMIETYNKVLDEAYARQNPGCVAGEFVVLAVSDTGVGIAPEIVEQVFEPFFSTKEAGKGTGLGLNLVYGFVNRSAGHIKIYSEVGIGTTIRIYLPRARKKSLVVNVPELRRQPKLAGGDEIILVVDDEEALREIAVMYLEGLGYQTLSATNSSEALELLRGPEKISLLLSDVVMPGVMDGYGLASTATAEYPSLKVLLTSGFTSSREEVGGSEKALYSKLSKSLLSKPYNRKELARAVWDTLNEKSE